MAPLLSLLLALGAQADPPAAAADWRTLRFPEGGELRYSPPTVEERDYPEAALDAGIEGTSLLQLTLDQGGRILACDTVISAGLVELDERACAIYRDRGRFELRGVAAPLTIRAPVTWRLEDPPAENESPDSRAQ